MSILERIKKPLRESEKLEIYMKLKRSNVYNAMNILEAIDNNCQENLYIRGYLKRNFNVELTQSNVSSTLKVLQSLDMVEYTMDGKKHLFQLTENWDKYENMIKMIDSYQMLYAV